MKWLPMLAMAVCVPSFVVAAEFPVSNPAELVIALKRARPADSLVMADGTWKDAEIVFAANGVAGKPVTLRAKTPGKVVLTGQSRLRIGGSHLVVDGLCFKDGCIKSGSVIEFRRDSKTFASQCRLTNCAITDYNPAERGLDYKWCSLYGQSNRVDHCYFAGKTHLGTTLVVWVGDQPDCHRIDHNHFGPRPPLGENGGETVRVGTSEVSMNVSRTIVEDNLFERCNGEAEIVSNKSCENIYRRNTFLECAGALTLRQGKRCEVSGNVFIGNGKKNTGGVRVICEDHRVVGNRFYDLTGKDARAALCLMNGIPDSPLHGYFQVKRALITSNTVVRCAQDILIGYAGKGATLPPVDCVITNNVITAELGLKAPDTAAVKDVGPAWRKMELPDRR
ncbi:MAG: right-handed parallel beta-helix repeat-containing protein [Verrucomicrobia bacterium]|nr:right-handed parallel beta-helix repeat-containing protein [Verrucomicrobiota bacterium]